MDLICVQRLGPSLSFEHDTWGFLGGEIQPNAHKSRGFTVPLPMLLQFLLPKCSFRIPMNSECFQAPGLFFPPPSATWRSRLGRAPLMRQTRTWPGDVPIPFATNWKLRWTSSRAPKSSLLNACFSDAQPWFTRSFTHGVEWWEEINWVDSDTTSLTNDSKVMPKMNNG